MDQKRVTERVSEEITTFDEDDFVILEALYKPILDELILDAIWNVCFEVHRAAQHEIYKEGKNLDDPRTDSSGQKTKNQAPLIPCLKCKLNTCATNYTTHLSKCLGGGRSSARAAKTRIKETNDGEEEEEEKGKKSRKKQGKKIKPLNKEQSSSKPNLTLEDLKAMSLDKREEFFSKNCGTISKKTRTLCKNSNNCKYHKDEARREIRFLLKISGDKTTNDEQIDVDTVEGNNTNCDNWF